MTTITGFKLLCIILTLATSTILAANLWRTLHFHERENPGCRNQLQMSVIVLTL